MSTVPLAGIRILEVGIAPPTGSSLGPLTNLGQGISWDNPDLGRLYSLEYSLHLQRQTIEHICILF